MLEDTTATGNAQTYITAECHIQFAYVVFSKERIQFQSNFCLTTLRATFLSERTRSVSPRSGSHKTPALLVQS